ncbi:MAG TPA: hypothetical protein VEQ10_03400 [Vicinamibacteria bacterium]|nr:hypothetical protein [Vicinamibacteria bacterium]
MQPPVTQQLEQDGVTSCRASDGDAQLGLVLRQVQQLGAVREHRRDGEPRIQTAGVDLANVRDEIGVVAP